MSAAVLPGTRRRTYDRAIADYDEAIRIDPNNGLSYLDRGFAWSAKKDVDRAIADYDEAIRRYPTYAEAFDQRGHAWQTKGNLDRAIADFGETIKIDPQHIDALNSRGRAYFYKGDFAASAADLLNASKRTEDPYTVLWRFLARARAGQDATSELSDNAARLKNKNWPYAVIEFYLGKRSLDAHARSGDKSEREMRGRLLRGRMASHARQQGRRQTGAPGRRRYMPEKLLRIFWRGRRAQAHGKLETSSVDELIIFPDSHLPPLQ